MSKNHFSLAPDDVASINGHTITFKDCESPWDTDYIFIRVEDARNLYEMLESKIPEGKSDKDYYGDKAISFERLYDYLECVDNPTKVDKWKSILANSARMTD